MVVGMGIMEPEVVEGVHPVRTDVVKRGSGKAGGRDVKYIS